jgi:predicted DCC family thiol-disulfide oxidoreductase YuxK
MSAGDPPPTAAAPPARQAAHRGATGAVIVFDGVCVLCNGWVRFLLARDRRQRYRFAPMQGDAGRALLMAHGLNPDDPVSFLLVEYDRGPVPRVSTESLAVLRVVAGLGGVWRLAAIARPVPPALRDRAYRVLARHRYRWFGRHQACVVPSAEHAGRFL